MNSRDKNIELVVELVMEHNMSIQDLLRVSIELSEEYSDMILTKKSARNLALESRKLMRTTIMILDCAAEAENEREV